MLCIKIFQMKLVQEIVRTCSLIITMSNHESAEQRQAIPFTALWLRNPQHCLVAGTSLETQSNVDL